MPKRRPIHRHQVLLAPDDAQLLPVHVIGERLRDIGAGVHEVQVQLLDHLRVIEQHFRHECAGLQVAASLELEDVAFRADHPTLAQAPQEVACGRARGHGARAGRRDARGAARLGPRARSRPGL